MNKDGGPAFPAGTKYLVVQSGMSLRDYFAGQALTGFCTLRVTQEDRDRANAHTDTEVLTRLVANAYHVADAMLKERAK